MPPPGVEPGHVTHPSTNRSRRRVTSLIRPTPLPLRHAATCVSSLAIPAYLASAASTLSPQAEIWSGCSCSDNSYFHEYLSLWSSSVGEVPDTGKEPFWDRPGIQADRLMVENSLSSPIKQAAFLAASSQHSGQWLFALLIASCRLRLDNEAVKYSRWSSIRITALHPTSLSLSGPGRCSQPPQYYASEPQAEPNSIGAGDDILLNRHLCCSSLKMLGVVIGDDFTVTQHVQQPVTSSDCVNSDVSGGRWTPTRWLHSFTPL